MLPRQARKLGILGGNVFESPFDFKIDVRIGAGAFVCGEETALMASVEGKRGLPRPRPPFSAESGLLEAGPGTVMGHTCDPRRRLALAEALYGRRPETWLATIPAADFGLGGRLSSTAKAGAAVALRQIDRLVHAGSRSDNKQSSPDSNGEAIMTPQNPKAGDVVSVRPLGAALAATNKTSLFKTDTLQAVRLVLPAGKEIAPHQSAGEATVQCLEGRVAFTVGEVVRELTAGDLLYLPAGATHALRGIEDASLLVTRQLR